MSTVRTHRGLICLKAAAPFNPSADALPEKLLFLKWGDNATTQGIVKVGEKTLQCLAANQKRAGYEEVVIDFGHNSVPTSETYKGEPAKVAATHCKPEVVRGEGLYLLSCQWTPDGIANARNYPDLSPAILTDEDGEVTFIHSGSICRNGATDGLRFFSANPLLSSMLNLDPLRKLLQLSADATDADINSAVDAALADNLITLSAKFGIKPAVVPPVTASPELTLLSTRLDKMERASYLDGVENIKADAANAGRVIPAAWLPDADGKGGLPLSELRTLSATLPISVPLEQRTPSHLRTLSAGGGLTSEDKEVCRVLGISEEAYKKNL